MTRLSASWATGTLAQSLAISLHADSFPCVDLTWQGTWQRLRARGCLLGNGYVRGL